MPGTKNPKHCYEVPGKLVATDSAFLSVGFSLAHNPRFNCGWHDGDHKAFLKAYVRSGNLLACQTSIACATPTESSFSV